MKKLNRKEMAWLSVGLGAVLCGLAAVCVILP